MRRASLIFTSLVLNLLFAIPAFAQTGEETAEKSYVLSYFVVGLGIALGLVAVCRNSKRRKEVRKPE